jgi:hypothetical protein
MDKSSDSDEGMTKNTKNTKNTPASNKKIVEKIFNEDDAMEIIEIEFQDLEDWLKREMKKLKKDSYNIIDCLKVKQNLSQSITNLYDN